MAMAEEVLDEFRDKFISAMDADAVVLNLLAKHIIDGGDKNRITQNANPEQKNQILHLALKQKCTDEALMEACDIIIAVNNRKMTALAEAMKEALVARTGLSSTPAPVAATAQKQAVAAPGKEEPDGPEKPQLPCGKPQFAIITANGREQNVVKRYLKLERVCEEVYAELMGYDWEHDPFLKEMDVKITANDPVGIYDVFTIGEVMGVHVNCPDYGTRGAQNTTSALLQKAKAEKWPLKVIFVVGCCGASMSDAKKGQKNWRGTVLLSDKVDDYLSSGKAEEDGFVFNSQPYTLSKMCVNWLSDGSICRPAVQENEYKMIPVEKVAKYLSGPLVMKKADLAKKYRGDCVMVGFEMEGTGVYSIVCNWAPTTEVAVVKGISDYADSDKKKPAKSVVFGTETAVEIDDDARQDIATFHAITLVTRCVAKNARRL